MIPGSRLHLLRTIFHFANRGDKRMRGSGARLSGEMKPTADVTFISGSELGGRLVSFTTPSLSQVALSRECRV